jgi:hypothetical protein
MNDDFDALDGPTPERTPENTPLPGGGSWKWDDASLAWVPAADHTMLPEQPAQEG